MDNKENTSKVELANKIANQSKKVAKTYEYFENNLFVAFRTFSSFIDKVLFSNRFTKLVSLCLALLTFLIVNFNSKNSIFARPITYSKTMPKVHVTALYNDETFEISGLPETVDVTVTGDGSSVNSAINQSGTVVANLEGLVEGTHNIKLSGDGFSDAVNLKIDPSNVIVTLKKKTTMQFDLSYDFINLDKMNKIYSAKEPVFDVSKINIRASKDTIESIAFVKALIDVSNQTKDFEIDAPIVAYNKNGQPLKVDIIPQTVHAKVPVSSPNKTVPITIQTTGSLKEGVAIESVVLDNETVTIYANEMVLSKIDQVSISLDLSTLETDSNLSRPIVLPTGVNSSNINQVNMAIKLGEEKSRTIDNVNINYVNNKNNYRFTPDNNISTVSVDVIGSETNINNINPDDINVYFDMENAKVGAQEFQLNIKQPNNPYIKFVLKQTTIKGVVIGDTNNNEE